MYKFFDTKASRSLAMGDHSWIDKATKIGSLSSCSSTLLQFHLTVAGMCGLLDNIEAGEFRRGRFVISTPRDRGVDTDVHAIINCIVTNAKGDVVNGALVQMDKGSFRSCVWVADNLLSIVNSVN